MAVVAGLEVELPMGLVVVEAALLALEMAVVQVLQQVVFLAIFFLVEQHCAIILEAVGRLLHLLFVVLLPNLAEVAVVVEDHAPRLLVIVVVVQSMAVLVAEVAGVLYFVRVVGFTVQPLALMVELMYILLVVGVQVAPLILAQRVVLERNR
jgi:hypothetical protein